MKIYNPSTRLRFPPVHTSLPSLHEISELNKGEPLRESNSKTQAACIQEDVELMECDVSFNDSIDATMVRKSSSLMPIVCFYLTLSTHRYYHDANKSIFLVDKARACGR
jgi:hypothetical protein